MRSKKTTRVFTDVLVFLHTHRNKGIVPPDTISNTLNPNPSDIALQRDSVGSKNAGVQLASRFACTALSGTLRGFTPTPARDFRSLDHLDTTALLVSVRVSHVKVKGRTVL